MSMSGKITEFFEEPRLLIIRTYGVGENQLIINQPINLPTGQPKTQNASLAYLLNQERKYTNRR